MQRNINFNIQIFLQSVFFELVPITYIEKFINVLFYHVLGKKIPFSYFLLFFFLLLCAVL